ncbi:MAG TPA: hypothetical protein VFD84_19750 [Candidatus Binatia bacterium]|nr:hypothetical protein [Candidatus Binatia bacterium]
MGAAAVIASDEWGECLVPRSSVPEDLKAAVRRAIGVVPGWLPRVAPCPWLARAMTALIQRPVAFAPPDLCDLIALVVSQDNSCRYCYGMQRTAMRIYGFDDAHIDRLIRDFHAAALPREQQAALEFARRVTRANPRPGRPELEEVLAAGVTREVAVEVVALAALNTFANCGSTLLALPPEPIQRFTAHPLFRVVRPLIAWRIRPRPRPPEPAPPPAEGPCGRVVGALGRLPSARVLRGIIDDAWASDILPRRTKTLLLGVVGKVLGCQHAEEEARAFLAADFSPAEVDDVFTHLHSPRLDAREARLVPFARETVRYQPGAVQRRLREVARGLTVAETVETVGVLALANTVCRLSVVLDAC